MNLNDVFDTLGDALATIDDLRVFDYFADRIIVPGVVVSFPETFNFDTAYKRGADRLTIPIIVVTGRLDARTSRNILSEYAASTGTKSVKQKLESFQTDIWDTLRITGVSFGILSYNGIEYLGATFNADVIG